MSGDIVVMSRNEPALVALSPESYLRLLKRAERAVDLGGLEERFEALVGSMRTGSHAEAIARLAIARLMDATDDELGDALEDYRAREACGSTTIQARSPSPSPATTAACSTRLPTLLCLGGRSPWSPR
ncbi:MAG: hypothetical protein RQ745_12155 [Longimicrobiales bacterium]|nr:hypothetical protein [Longimicrobiales bacterium]